MAVILAIPWCLPAVPYPHCAFRYLIPEAESIPWRVGEQVVVCLIGHKLFHGEQWVRGGLGGWELFHVEQCIR